MTFACCLHNYVIESYTYGMLKSHMQYGDRLATKKVTMRRTLFRKRCHFTI